MSKKIFMGIAILDDEGNATKALGMVQDMESGKIKKVNTEKLSDKAAKIMVVQICNKMEKAFLRTESLESKELVKLPNYNDIL